jgi:hypothetical protein
MDLADKAARSPMHSRRMFTAVERQLKVFCEMLENFMNLKQMAERDRQVQGAW